MIKAFAVAVSGVLAGSAALAGPYVNVENNAGYSGGDYQGATTMFTLVLKAVMAFTAITLKAVQLSSAHKAKTVSLNCLESWVETSRQQSSLAFMAS